MTTTNTNTYPKTASAKAQASTSQITSSNLPPEDLISLSSKIESRESNRHTDISNVASSALGPEDIEPFGYSNGASFSNNDQANQHFEMADISLEAELNLEDDLPMETLPSPSLRCPSPGIFSPGTPFATPSMRSPSPAASDRSVRSDIDFAPLPPKITIVEEAEHKVKYYTWRKELLISERVAADNRVKTTYYLFKLRRIQAVLAQQRVFEAESDIGRSHVELTNARRRVKSVVNGVFPFRSRRRRPDIAVS